MVCLCEHAFSVRRRETFGHVETAIFQLLVLLAQSTALATEVDAAVHAGRLLQAVLRPHRRAFGTRVQPVAAYAPQANIQGTIHAAC